MKTKHLTNLWILLIGGLLIAESAHAHVMRSEKICGTKAINSNDVTCEGNGCENCDKNWVNGGNPWCSAYNPNWTNSMCVSTINHNHDGEGNVVTQWLTITFNHQDGTCLNDPESSTCPCELGATVEDSMDSDHNNATEPCPQQTSIHGLPTDLYAGKLQHTPLRIFIKRDAVLYVRRESASDNGQ